LPKVGQPVRVGWPRPPVWYSKRSKRIAGGVHVQELDDTRRTALGSAAAFAAGAPFPPLRRTTSDRGRHLGGDFSRTLARNRDGAARPKGWDVVKDEANAPPAGQDARREGDARGTSESRPVASDMYEVNEQGTIEQLDYSKIPNAAN